MNINFNIKTETLIAAGVVVLGGIAVYAMTKGDKSDPETRLEHEYQVVLTNGHDVTLKAYKVLDMFNDEIMFYDKYMKVVGKFRKSDISGYTTKYDTVGA